MFFEEDYNLEVYMLCYDIIKTDSQKYVNYHMLVKIASHEYKIQKRYNEFKELHNVLQKNYPNAYQFEEFPKKTMFHRFENSVIKDRRKKFKSMISYLTSTYRRAKITDYLEFLELYKIIIEIPQPLHMSFRQHLTMSVDSESIISSYLTQLNECGGNFIQIIGQLDEYFGTTKPTIPAPTIHRFLLGDGHTQGLLYICFQKSKDDMHLTCSRCIQFLTN